MTVELEMRQILAEMQLLAYGTTTSLGASKATDDPGGKRPAGGDVYPLHDEYRERWNRCAVKPVDDSSEALRASMVRTQHNQQQCLDAARSALTDARRKPETVEPVEETGTALDARIIRDGRGWSIKDVARSMRCTESRVRRARLASGADAATGEPGNVRGETANARAVELAAMGMTERQIHMFTGLAKSTVRRVLGRAA